MCNKNTTENERRSVPSMIPEHRPMLHGDVFPFANEQEWLEGLFTGGAKHHTKLERKRKSVEIEPEPKVHLERRRSSAGPVLTRSVSDPRQSRTFGPKRKRGRPRKNVQSAIVFESKEADCEIPLPEPFQFSSANLKDNTDDDLCRFLEQLLEDDFAEAPLMAEEIPEVTTEAEQTCEDDLNKKRSKWTEAELLRLWQGIAKHGNNWTAIRGTCLGRSYCQIKDKGRRCLFLLGWETGRSKVETDSSSLHAKRIANAVLAEMK